jgi:hypothetical protein
LRAVELSACVNGWNRRASVWLVDADAGVADLDADQARVGAGVALTWTVTWPSA